MKIANEIIAEIKVKLELTFCVILLEGKIIIKTKLVTKKIKATIIEIKGIKIVLLARIISKKVIVVP